MTEMERKRDTERERERERDNCCLFALFPCPDILYICGYWYLFDNLCFGTTIKLVGIVCV